MLEISLFKACPLEDSLSGEQHGALLYIHFHALGRALPRELAVINHVTGHTAAGAVCILHALATSVQLKHSIRLSVVKAASQRGQPEDLRRGASQHTFETEKNRGVKIECVMQACI